MTTTSKRTIPASHVSLLAALRGLAAEPSSAVTAMHHTADRQARLLRSWSPIPVTRILDRLSTLIPSVRVDYLATMPVPGTAFWGDGHWHIHVRAGDPEETQALTVLHALKHIIDHPLRRQPNALTSAEWEELADYFARQVLTREVRSGSGSAIKNEGENDDIAADMRHSPPQPKTQTGGTR